MRALYTPNNNLYIVQLIIFPFLFFLRLFQSTHRYANMDETSSKTGTTNKEATSVDHVDICAIASFMGCSRGSVVSKR
jgi:hypothetical protein